MAAGIQKRVFGKGSGGDKPDHFAPDHGFGTALFRLRRIFRLFADSNTVAEPDQAFEIFIRRMDRHPAHGNVLPQMLAALGQRDAERARGDFGVFEE